MRRRPALHGLVIGGTIALSGCVLWPTMTQPGIRITVRDRDGRAVAGASFHLARYTVSMVPRSVVTAAETDARGEVVVESEREWQVFFLAPDSGRFWSWSWCVDEPGFEAVVANDLRADPRRRHADVVLVPTSDRQRCVWRERPPAFEVVR